MSEVIDRIRGRIIDYDEKTGELVIRAKYSDIPTMVRREYDEVEIQLIDSRQLSSRQRRACYAMIAAIADWAGYERNETKNLMKLEFWTAELYQTADRMFSLSNAPMSIVAAFQSWLARFIVANDVPTKKHMLDYIDDVESYVYACLAHKTCAVCGKRADLHHVDTVGAGRNRDEIIHAGMRVLPLCREHHTETHTLGQSTFIARYHLCNGIPADKTICKLYNLKWRSEK